MADVEINVSGTMSPPPMEDKSGSGFYIPQSLSPQAWLHQCYQNLRPWSTFLNSSNYKPPSGVPQLTKRLMKNLSYFLSNYAVIVFILTLYCLITTPLLLIAVCCSLGACYALRRRHEQAPIVIMGRRIPPEQQYALVGVCSFPFFILLGASSAMFWVLGASLFFITLHAVFFNITAIINEDEERFNSMLEEV